MKMTVCAADDYRRFVCHLSGRVRSRYHPEYDGWLRQSAWNRRDFGRLPEMIVRAQSTEDVADTLRFARKHKHKVAVRAGGHSYCGCFLHTNSILLDISALQDINIDTRNKTAAIGPGVTARQLTAALNPYGLSFPTGHGGNVALSGFLLGGGMGINSSAWGGMSVFSMEAVDLITAEGELLHANAHQNPDLFWAARGGGPNVFFVVVCFYLRCYPHPVINNRLYQLSWQDLVPLMERIAELKPDPRLQIMLALFPGQSATSFTLNTLAFTADTEESRALQDAFISRLPVEWITMLSESTEGTFEEIYRQGEGMLTHTRYSSDNVIISRPSEVIQKIEGAVSDCPCRDAITLIVWRGKHIYPAAAYSVSGDFFVSTYMQWDRAEDDDTVLCWLKKLYDQFRDISEGCYINEFDLENRSGEIERCYAPENWSRLVSLRRDYDPSGVFVDISTSLKNTPF
ncbi:FAD-binding oxidoreductase [Enterobacter ludwigii]